MPASERWRSLDIGAWAPSSDAFCAAPYHAGRSEGRATDKSTQDSDADPDADREPGPGAETNTGPDRGSSRRWKHGGASARYPWLMRPAYASVLAVVAWACSAP